MRFAAQRTIELQGFLPAQSGSSGLPYMVSSKLISDAVDNWEKTRGLRISPEQLKAAHWKEAMAHRQRKRKELEEEKIRKQQKAVEKQVKAPKPKRVLSASEKERQKETRKKYKELNRDKIREEKRLAAQRRRDAMTPEQRQAESKKIQAYNKARLERQKLEKQQLRKDI